MGIEENKKTLQQYFDEVMNGRDYTNIDELMHDDFNGKPGQDIISGKEAHKKYGEYMYSVFPDLRTELLEMIAEGDNVVAYSRATCTHTGADFMGQPASGRKAEFDVIVIYTFKDGKLISGRVVQDQLSAFQQLGFYPPMPELK